MKRILILAALALLGMGCAEEPRGGNVPLNEVPESVMKMAKEKLPGIQFEQAWKTPTGNYEVRGKDKNGKVRDSQIKPDSEVVEVD
jgi:hypothetical protein